MARYVLEKDGYAVNVILAESDEMAQHAASLNGAIARILGDGEVPQYAPEPPPPRETSLTQLGFLRRFTVEERVSIRTAATTNPVIADFLYMLDLAQDINLDDPDTVAGLAYLESQELLEKGRTSVIRGIVE